MTSLRQIKLSVNCSNFSGVLLTAAHKVVGKDPGDLTTRCGEWDIKHTNELEPHQDRSVNTIVFHPSFNGARVILIQTESIIHILQFVSGIERAELAVMVILHIRDLDKLNIVMVV